MSMEPEAPAQEPPAEKSAALRWAFIGLALNAAAALIGQLSPAAEEMGTPQRFGVALLLGGCFVSGCTLTLRPGWSVPWLLASLSAFAGCLALPPAWSSIPLLMHGLILVSGVVGLVLVDRSFIRRCCYASAFIGFHFFGISMAILSPAPSPWLVYQIWQGAVGWWFDSIYMSNAYQFYAPDPGPANLVWFCLEYRREPKGTPTVSEQIASQLNADTFVPRAHRWIKMPVRPGDFRDPLGVSYYRRLALTEYTNLFSTSNYNAFPSEASEVQQRRQSRARDIPFHSQLAYPSGQFRPPVDMVRMLLLPSYAQHMAAAHRDDYPAKDGEAAWTLYSVRIYRVLHQIVPPEKYGQEKFYMHPYDPATYFPYFQGEYAPDGTLIDPLDPMLYWEIPIERRDPASSVGSRFEDPDYFEKYDDFLIVHAGSNHTLSGLQDLADFKLKKPVPDPAKDEKKDAKPPLNPAVPGNGSNFGETKPTPATKK